MKSEEYLPSRPFVLKCKELDIELTPMITARLKKKLVFAQLAKKFLAFRLIIVFTKAKYRTLSQCTSSHLFIIRPILILLFHTHTHTYIYIYTHFSYVKCTPQVARLKICMHFSLSPRVLNFFKFCLHQLPLNNILLAPTAFKHYTVFLF
jgi:hypothetical protein